MIRWGASIVCIWTTVYLRGAVQIAGPSNTRVPHAPENATIPRWLLCPSHCQHLPVEFPCVRDLPKRYSWGVGENVELSVSLTLRGCLGFAHELLLRSSRMPLYQYLTFSSASFCGLALFAMVLIDHVVGCLVYYHYHLYFTVLSPQLSYHLAILDTLAQDLHYYHYTSLAQTEIQLLLTFVTEPHRFFFFINNHWSGFWAVPRLLFQCWYNFFLSRSHSNLYIMKFLKCLLKHFVFRHQISLVFPAIAYLPQ